MCSWARNFAVTMSYSAYQILIMDTREFMEQPGRMLHPIQVAIPEAASYFQNNLGLILDYIRAMSHWRLLTTWLFVQPSIANGL